MSGNDTTDDEPDDTEATDSDEPLTTEIDVDGRDVRDRLEQEADRAVDQFDEGIVDLLAWILDTETRARIYVTLRQHPNSTSEEIAEGTGLYPSTVREALAKLHDEGTVIRQKRQNSGAGNNPYEYATIPPSELVSDVVEDVQQELNTVFNLDRYLGQSETDETDEARGAPVTINVEAEADIEAEPDVEETDSASETGTGDEYDTTE